VKKYLYLNFRVAGRGFLFEYRAVNKKYAQEVLTQLRSKETSQVEFRKGLVRLGRVLGLEIVEDFETEEKLVETPLGAIYKGIRIKDFEKVCIITVLRAAWPLTEGLVKIFYSAKQGVIAARRAEEKGMHNREFDIEVNYVKVPKMNGDEILIISDVSCHRFYTNCSLKGAIKEGKGKKVLYCFGDLNTGSYRETWKVCRRGKHRSEALHHSC
jgi:uracil phosphoribosyltransferase